MKKRLIALFCMVALLLGVFAIGAAASSAEGDGMYDVGYAKVNVNPWIQTTAVDYLNPANPDAIGIPDNSANWQDLQDGATVNNVVSIEVTDPTNSAATVQVPFVSVPMAGYGTYATPSCASLFNDNGDGIIGLGDGLYSTVTTVTDDWGNTVIYITIDSIGGYAGLTSSLRSSIPAALQELTGKTILTGDKIMVSANHSHNSVNIDTCRGDYLKKVDGVYVNQDENGNATTALGAYFQYYLKTVTDAAVEAYQNAVPAVMSKGAIEASSATGYQLNFVRHYDVTATDNDGNVETGLVRGSNFGPTAGDAATDSVTYVSGGEAHESHLYEADDMLYTLKFTPVDTSIEPVVFVNWRAHSTIVSGSSKTYLSSDYASSLRRFMEEAGYRPAFWQGAAGNLVPSSSDPTISASNNASYWPNLRRTDLGITYNTDETASSEHNLAYKAVLYGKLLTEATVECLDSDNMTDLPAGPIRTRQVTFNADLQIVEEGSGMAAAVQKWVEDGKPKNYKTLGGTEYSFLGRYFPMEYEHTDGNTYILNSYFHANNMLNRYNSTSTHTKYELNTIAMGDGFALVSSPCEMFDRYDLNGSNAWEDNDWLELVDDTYGTPFYLGYSNQHGPYLSNVSGFHYNDNATHYAAGCYEANTSVPAEKNGEAVIQSFKTMLYSVTDGYKEEKCSVCNETVTWEPILSTDKFNLSDGGHYYLLEDASVSNSIDIPGTVCLDLNGHSLTGKCKVFTSSASTTLNLLDGVGTGKVNAIGSGSGHVGGIAQLYGTINIYGGTYAVVGSDLANPTAGGLFAVQTGGSLNIYGGTLYGADLSDEIHGYYAKDGSGSAIYLYGGSNLFVGGDARIVSGTIPAHGVGPCIVAHLATSQITLQDNAKVDDIYFLAIGDSSLTVSGAYTGTANITLGADVTLEDGMDIGTSNNADLSGATITCTNDPEYKLHVSASNLVLQRDPVAYIGETPYFTLQDAVNAAAEGATIRLSKNVAETVSVAKNMTIDLNGFDITNITAEGCTLTAYDSQTNDYDVADGIYGKITGNAVAAEGYMAVTGDNGTSFHKVDLAITAMSLRASVAGVYYKSSFRADEVAAKSIAKYGVALSVKGEPNETNMGTTSAYSYFTNFTSGNATGTLLKNIMKTGNTDANNSRNANMSVYGRPYILTTDGQYVFGTTVQRSLKQQLEAIDAAWANYSDAAQESVLWMYKRFQSTTDSWNLPNIKYDADPANDGILKVLIVGNSHGLDSTNLLGEVFKDQRMKSEEYVIGALYTGGCRMDQHADFMTNNKTYYSYHENGGPDDTNGAAWTVVNNPTPNVPFDRHQWDVVIMQQMNHRAGVEDQYVKSQFETVINYIYDHQIGIPKLGWQMIWANPDNYETYLDDDAPLINPSPKSWREQHEAWYGIGKAGTYLSKNMYNKVVACTQKFITDSSDFLGKDYFDFVIPAATTIQYAREILGYEQDQLYRDYTHLSDFGRLMSAYTWYGKIMECVSGEAQTISSVGIAAIPAGLRQYNSTYPTADSNYAVTTQMQSDIKTAVNWALAHPYELPEASADNANDGVTKILGIGNSYTIDSLHLLGEIYKAEKPGTNLELGIAYYSGCSLQSHVSFYNANDAVYGYYYYSSETDTWTVTNNVTLKQIIQAQDWDMVSLQQNSSGSGLASGYDYIPTVRGIVEKELLYKPTYLWNMTWAVPEVDIPTDRYTLEDAPNAYSFKTYYQSSQATMYKMIVECVQNKVVPDTAFKYLMPVGTAIQNANATFTDYDLYRDYTHLNDYARLIAAYTWYCELEGTTLDTIKVTAVPAALTNSYKDGGNYTLTEQQITVLVNAVKSAMSAKFQTTDTSVYG